MHLRGDRVDKTLWSFQIFDYNYTSFQLILHQTEFHLVPNQSENGYKKPNLVWISKIQKRFLCV